MNLPSHRKSPPIRLTILRWGTNGNLPGTRDARGGERRIVLTKKNPLQAFWEHSRGKGDIVTWYSYTAGDERSLKLTSPKVTKKQNESQHKFAQPLFTLTKHGYTSVTEFESKSGSLALPRCSNVTEGKHYFEDGRRICSKIGGGLQGKVTASEVDSLVRPLAYTYEVLFSRQHEGILRTFEGCAGAEPQIVRQVSLRRVLAVQETQRDASEPAFFYHSDHLDSAAYLTSGGHVTQTLNYLPYGEDWVESNHFNPNDTTRLGIFRFNGKEKDHESGLHYYGARYYWSEALTGWLSVDPMTDKYPNISSYAYCAWNPVKLVDPDGNKIKLVQGTDDEGNQTMMEVTSISDFPDDERMNIIREIYKTTEGKVAIDEIMKSEIEFTILEKMEDVDDHEVTPYGEVSWGNPSKSHGGDAKHVLAEELYHCYQIATNKWKFDGSMSKNDMYNYEIQAKTFAASLFPYSSFWRHYDGYYVPTQMYIMAGYDNQLKKSYLQNESYTTLPKYKNDPSFNPMEPQYGEYLHKGAYKY